MQRIEDTSKTKSIIKRIVIRHLAEKILIHPLFKKLNKIQYFIPRFLLSADNKAEINMFNKQNLNFIIVAK